MLRSAFKDAVRQQSSALYMRKKYLGDKLEIYLQGNYGVAFIFAVNIHGASVELILFSSCGGYYSYWFRIYCNLDVTHE